MKYYKSAEVKIEHRAFLNRAWQKSVDNGFEKLFAVIGKRYEQYGYKLPRLVFWNLNSRTGTIPIKENEMGVALVSGFSPSVATMVLSGKMDPFECLLDALNVERYKAVEVAVKDVLR